MIKKISLAVVAASFVYCVYGCVVVLRTGTSIAANEKTIRENTAFTICAEEAAKLEAVLQTAIEQHVVRKVKVDKTRLIAELYVLPAIRGLDIDTKSTLLHVAYRSAFGLPSNAKKFTGLMYVIDGTTGRQLQTLDMESRGTAFREW